MSEKLDDLEAVRTLVNALQGFEASDQERIIRWAREKLGLSVYDQTPARERTPGEDKGVSERLDEQGQPSNYIDLKTFVTQKNPTNDNHFAATVAYYYLFIATDAQKKDSITADDLQEACRLVGRERFHYPGQTLRNTLNSGLLDKADRGAFKINSVGENLVAMTLPAAASTGAFIRKLSAKKPVKRNKGAVKAPGRQRKTGERGKAK